MQEIKFNPSTGAPEISGSDLSIQDIDEARAVRKLMKSPGWKVLSKYFEIGRESVIDAIKDCVSSVEKRDLASQRGAVLKGWDACFTLPNRIVKRLADYEQVIAQKQKEEDTDERDEDEI